MGCVRARQQNLLSSLSMPYRLPMMDSQAKLSADIAFPSFRLLPDADLDVLADALGDPTRRAIFHYVTESHTALTAGEVGDYFNVHRTVARAHLEHLLETKLLQASTRRNPGGGRPPKVYSRSGRRLDLQLPARQYEVLASLLLGSLESFGDAATMVVEEVGSEFGKKLAEESKGEGADPLQPLAEAGADVETQSDGNRVDITLRNCLYREIAAPRPRLVCALDRAIIRGMLSATGSSYSLDTALLRSDEEAACRLIFTKDRRVT